ncbi:helix-turn-helix domain-containing protein [Rhodococcus ruber]|uniref:helix-turn-helix domain-containing protein n=1 Tax=Rhodococcus ruber TaxID=1830 RepID=UPI00177FB625|nr:helix-turn-helix domain-containing protein [Rhodococcus ruber]MBD8057264.1 helix-turn-helix domain-containing protein [Rhodococcus ruber]
MNHTSRTPELLTITAAARYIGTSVATIENWVRTGHLEPVATPGGTWRRFRRADLDYFIDALETHPKGVQS